MYGKPKSHDGVIRTIATDAVNKTLATAGTDRTVKFWNFNTFQLEGFVELDTPVVQMELNRESALLAVSCEDFSLRILDFDSRRTVRVFTGHFNRITDLAWSPDARWIVSSAMDTTIRTWGMCRGPEG